MRIHPLMIMIFIGFIYLWLVFTAKKIRDSLIDGETERPKIDAFIYNAIFLVTTFPQPFSFSYVTYTELFSSHSSAGPGASIGSGLGFLFIMIIMFFYPFPVL